MSKTEPKSSRRPSYTWLQGLACGAVATLATPTAVLIAILMAPAAAAWLLDRSTGRAIGRAVLLCGLAGTVHPLLMLWRSTQNIDAALGLALDVRLFVIAWAAQAAGWLACELIPLCIQLTMESAASARAIGLRRARTRYEEDWDLPPAPEAPTAATPGGSGRRSS